jgi:hypothetical protein
VNLVASRIVLFLVLLVCCPAVFAIVRKRWLGVLASVGVAVFIIALDVIVPKPDTLSLRCRTDNIPVVDFPGTAPSTVLVDPSFYFGSINQWLVRSSKGYPPSFTPKSTSKLIYQCELLNTAGIGLFNVRLPVDVLIVPAHVGHDADKNPTLACNELETTEIKHPIVPAGDMPSGARFFFYFYNGTNNCASIRFRTPQSNAWMSLHLKVDEETRLASLPPTEIH